MLFLQLQPGKQFQILGYCDLKIGKYIYNSPLENQVIKPNFLITVLLAQICLQMFGCYQLGIFKSTASDKKQ